MAHRLWFAHPCSRGKVSQVREEPGSSPEGGICWLPGWGAPPYTVHRPGGPEERYPWLPLLRREKVTLFSYPAGNPSSASLKS